MTASSPPAIAATGLRKSYGQQVVLDGIDLDVAEGTKRVRRPRHDAGRGALVRREPALHAHDRDVAELLLGKSAVIAVAWCAAIALVGYLWARAAYNRDPVR